MEAIKDRLNAGETVEMYFYRDSEGNEIDLLWPVGRKLYALEIKSGSTVNADYFEGLNTFAKHCASHLEGGGVIYGGSEHQARQPWPVHSWLDLSIKPGLSP